MPNEKLSKKERKIALKKARREEKLQLKKQRNGRVQNSLIEERLRPEETLRLKKYRKGFLFIDHTNKKMQIRVLKKFYPILDKSNVKKVQIITKKQLVEKTVTYEGPNSVSSFGTFTNFNSGHGYPGFGMMWSSTNLPEYKKYMIFEYATKLVITTNNEKMEFDLDDQNMASKIKTTLKEIFTAKQILPDEKDYSQMEIFILPKLKELLDSKVITKKEFEKRKNELLDIEK